MADAASLEPVSRKRTPAKKKPKRRKKEPPPPKNDGERASRAMDVIRKQRAEKETAKQRKEATRGRVRRARNACKAIVEEAQALAKRLDDVYWKGGIQTDNLMGKPSDMLRVVEQGCDVLRELIKTAEAEAVSLRFAQLCPLPGEEGYKEE